MLNKLFSLVLIMAFLLLFSCADKKVIEFERHYGSSETDYGTSVEQTPDGGYIICGSTKCSINQDKGYGYIIKTNSYGDTLWTKAYGGDGLDWLQSIVLLPDGYIFAGISSSFSKGRKIWILETDRKGNMRQNKVYCSASDQLMGAGINKASDGGYIVSGGYVSHYFPTMGVLLKLNAKLDSVWAKFYEGGTMGNACQISDSRYAFVGTRAKNGVPNYWLGITDANGDTLWTRTYPSNGWAFSMEPTKDGGFIVGGTSQNLIDTKTSACLLKIDREGNKNWMEPYPANITEPNFSVTQTADLGYAFTTLNFSNRDKTEELLFIKTDTAGFVLRNEIFGTPESNERGTCIRQTRDGGYIITGMTDQFDGNRDVYLVKTR
jgi:hypothetical protein